MTKRQEIRKQKKEARKEIMLNNQKIREMLIGNVKIDMKTVNRLIQRNTILRDFIEPKTVYDKPSRDVYDKSLMQEQEHKGYCKNCGAENDGNNVNGKLWCFKCNSPMQVTYDKPERNFVFNPKLECCKEEQENFFNKQKELGFIECQKM